MLWAFPFEEGVGQRRQDSRNELLALLLVGQRDLVVVTDTQAESLPLRTVEGDRLWPRLDPQGVGVSAEGP